MKMLGTWEIEDIEVEDIEWEDVPDFCNAFIASATVNGHDATEQELDTINEDSDFVYACTMEHLGWD